MEGTGSLRTLFVSPDFKPARGGIAELYVNLLCRFPAGAVEVSTIRAPAGWRDAYPFHVERLPVGFRESSRLQNVVRWTRWSRARVRSRGYDALQIGTLRPAGAVGAWVNRLEGVPFVIYVHGKDVLKERRKIEASPLYRATARDILRRVGAVIANSRFTADLVVDLGGAAGVSEIQERVKVVHPGADIERFRPSAGRPPPVEDPARRRVVLTVARLEPRKGVDRALEAVARIAPQFPDLLYVVAGDGPQRAALEERARAPDLAGRVRFLGHVPDADLPDLYRSADVFLLASRRESGDEVEGFGIVLCEAAASGVPVVAGRSGGVPEAVSDGETGLVVDPEDPTTIASALCRLLGDEALAHRLGDAGRRATETYLNWDRAAAEAWRIVEETAEAGRPRGRFS